MKNTAQSLAGIYCYLVPYGNHPDDCIERSKLCLVKIHEAEEMVNAAGYMICFSPIVGDYKACFDKPVIFTSRGGRGQIGYNYAVKLLKMQNYKYNTFLKKLNLGMKLAELIEGTQNEETNS